METLGMPTLLLLFERANRAFREEVRDLSILRKTGVGSEAEKLSPSSFQRYRSKIE
jgi:hypothetical protein